jgi:hypothetical protein
VAEVAGWTDAYGVVVGRLLQAPGSINPVADAELLIAAAEGLLIAQLSSGDRGERSPRLTRLACAIVARA